MNTAVSAVEVVSNPVKVALSLSRRLSEDEIKSIAPERELAVADLSKIDQLRSSLLPVEKSILPIVNAKMTEIANRIKKLDSFGKLNQYSLFSLESLTWRDGDGFPRLAVFSIESPSFELAVIGRRRDGRIAWSKKINPRIPKDMMNCYGDIFGKLSEIARQTQKTIRLRAQFGMLIPKSVKDKIAQVRGQFKEIFIIAEAPHWDLALTSPSPQRDPLVVGYDGANYWLIAWFDPTTLEEYIKSEFCVKGSVPETGK